MNIPRIIISAPQRNSGKTTLSIGLCHCFTENGLIVQSFKKGPDFIDPMWLSSATNRPCHNLDSFMMGNDAVMSTFQKRSQGIDLAVIEGNMSLYDGYDIEGTGSTAQIARMLRTPVILVVNVMGTNRGIAPLILGYQQFEPDTPIVGVIFNKVKGKRHESKLRQAVEHYCDIDVLGAIPPEADVTITMRHLGLVPIQEDPALQTIIKSIGQVVKDHVNLDQILKLAKNAPSLPEEKNHSVAIDLHEKPKSKVKIGVAKDRAFNFYYPENLEALSRSGAELVFFNTLVDKKLPEIDGLYIGGGFPEVMMAKLEENTSMRKELEGAVQRGMPVYAECGGLMYMARSISWKDELRKMTGAIPCDIKVYDKPKGHGYVQLKTTGNSSWFHLEKEIMAHEFHYSEIINLDQLDFAYEVKRGYGIDGSHDGLLYKNVLASYAHLHSMATPQWAEAFVHFVQETGFKL